uniref:SCP domain-containing protein n=1 Tax=Chromera velia CCMP2878 TaxID=1169474 RepID=A0A0G4G2M7_9ALVE|mmetsp:Transcript_8507/g.16600  ORF Transcript_8507/g.16600 Transcript_8507/m.16600 type:complete len:320 (+) Transcript_8507:167-1126(+)|eukprot:Cvel_19959.t1-p1 / transcript=Cvel_19959.t1 / gene=Cvel_19959 / organism=Chromera_velia_CCMP2878 / gene_product=Golgi-associated plant pathogenesis-related protein, putative / transcript_product=Golgi-associated plant pathogenesis-related protein, putative / location=Cvel_scaffold1757:16676-19116(+) / protein_length=319 / sequence_SO=supercontig / SO=protein_coding / is_pseudo=false
MGNQVCGGEIQPQNEVVVEQVTNATTGTAAPAGKAAAPAAAGAAPAEDTSPTSTKPASEPAGGAPSKASAPAAGGSGMPTKEMVVKLKGGCINDPKWREVCLAQINAQRKKHGAPPLVWNEERAKHAQLCADQCAAEDRLFHCHSHEYGDGQNVFSGTAGQYGAEDAIDAWYSELTDPGYKWNANSAQNGCSGTGHFTQNVWRDSVEFGMAADKEGKGFICANFWPAGNMQGLYGDNVHPAGTAMQKRKIVRKTAFKGKVASMTADGADCLDSIPHAEMAAMLKAEIEAGRPVELEYSPAPNGSFKWSKQDGSMGMASF